MFPEFILCIKLLVTHWIKTRYKIQYCKGHLVQLNIHIDIYPICRYKMYIYLPMYDFIFKKEHVNYITHTYNDGISRNK